MEAGREEQQQAQEQFLTTYERFQQATGFRGDDLEDFYGDLNAAAIHSLGKDSADTQSEVDTPIRDMQRSIAEADAFVATLGT